MNLDRTKWNINIGCLYEFSRLDSAEIVDAYTVPGWYADKVKKGDGFNPISIRKKNLVMYDRMINLFNESIFAY